MDPSRGSATTTGELGRHRPGAPLISHQQRRSLRGGHVVAGTLACGGCDAPIALGVASVAPTAPLACPFCGRAGTVREFLSLAVPSRPARVLVRLSLAARPG